jgi:hypothetical protein
MDNPGQTTQFYMLHLAKRSKSNKNFMISLMYSIMFFWVESYIMLREFDLEKKRTYLKMILQDCIDCSQA